VVIGSPCRCTTFQGPSSGLRIIVVRGAIGVMSSLPPTLALGEDHLVGFGVAFDELDCREVVLLEHFVDIVYRGHLDCSFPSIPCTRHTLFTILPGRGVLGELLIEGVLEKFAPRRSVHLVYV
jgi:hypothetical protein